ncbi:alpha/beta hydrolase [Dactylosporangium roseum]|uniref:Alpha/beta hydrolase n=1 Tax=Dactylosporangium roseum TaxID=47989 RepID=A0ABY5YZV7_9ACTN|nr:alpha/beta hydrolase [Dactylosporangium roseum]UWZ34350.1 alpha/beta hydrolase [Dactylosporangium roseum]
MADDVARLRVPEHVYRALGYLFPRLFFLNARYAPQVHWGDIAAALDGFPAEDLDLSSAAFWNDWRERWTARADDYARLAERSSTVAGRSRALRGAAAAYHWAEFQYFDDHVRKRHLRRRIRDCFLGSLNGTDLGLAEGRLPARAGRPEVPYWLLTTPAMRAAGRPLPAVLLSNGLDSATEIELLALAEAYLERGIAAVLFEGPGQGLQLGRSPLHLAMEEVVADLVAHLAAEPGIEADRLAFAGISFGGHIALRVAGALGERFRCVVNFGGGPALNKFDGLPRRLKANFRFALGADVAADLQPRFDELALDPGRPPATEVLSIHGALDDIFPVEGLTDLDRAWSGRHRLVVHPREAHTSLNVINSYTLETADWVAGRLERRPG